MHEHKVEMTSPGCCRPLDQAEAILFVEVVVVFVVGAFVVVVVTFDVVVVLTVVVDGAALF